MWPLFLAAAGFGFLDACQNTLVFGILSSVFPEEQEQICAFAGKIKRGVEGVNRHPEFHFYPFSIRVTN